RRCEYKARTGRFTRVGCMNFAKHNVGVLDRPEAAAPVGLAGSRDQRRWPISYGAIGLVTALSDIAIIFATALISGVAYHLEAIGMSGDVDRYIGSATIVSALFISLMKSRELYAPAALLKIAGQIRSVIATWICVFLLLAAAVFTLKMGD